MLDKHGKPLNVGDRVRWNSMGDKVVGTVRKIRPSHIRGVKEECVCDDGDPSNPDYTCNGWSNMGALSSRQVTLVSRAPTAEQIENIERAELARLLAKYPDAVGGKEKA